jgi:hypothetical protein
MLTLFLYPFENPVSFRFKRVLYVEVRLRSRYVSVPTRMNVLIRKELSIPTG